MLPITQAGREYNWKPGQPSPNPAGRPRKRPITEAYEKWMRAAVDPRDRAKFAEKGYYLAADATNADAVAFAQGRKALAGDTLAAKEMREAIEGRSKMRIEVNSMATPRLVVQYEPAILKERIFPRERLPELEPPEESAPIDVEHVAAVAVAAVAADATQAREAAAAAAEIKAAEPEPREQAPIASIPQAAPPVKQRLYMRRGRV
jgi:hypothetical protein